MMGTYIPTEFGKTPVQFKLRYSGHRWFLLADDPYDGPRNEETGERPVVHRPDTAVASVYSYHQDTRSGTAALFAASPDLRYILEEALKEHEVNGHAMSCPACAGSTASEEDCDCWVASAKRLLAWIDEPK